MSFVLIMGDFNADLTKTDKFDCKQLSTMFELKILEILSLDIHLWSLFKSVMWRTLKSLGLGKQKDLYRFQ